MAVGTDHVGPIRRHVHIELTLGLEQRGIEIAVLDGIAPPAIEVAVTAVLAAGAADVLRDVGQVRRLEQLFARRAFHRLELAVGIQRMAGIGAKLAVGAVVSWQARQSTLF
jgi:hypothetical protein